MEKELQDFKDKINLKQGFNAYWNKGFDDAVKFLKDNGALSQHDVSGSVCDFIGCKNKATNEVIVRNEYYCDKHS
jgi:hypothetical protein